MDLARLVGGFVCRRFGKADRTDFGVHELTPKGVTGALKADHESRDNRLGELSGAFGISADEMKVVERTLRLSRNEFSLTA